MQRVSGVGARFRGTASSTNELLSDSRAGAGRLARWLCEGQQAAKETAIAQKSNGSVPSSWHEVPLRNGQDDYEA